MDFERLSQALNSSEANWVASRDPYVDLVEGEMTYLGVPTPDVGEMLAAASSGKVIPFPFDRAVQPRVDWRAREGTWTSEPRHQGLCGSCTAFALCAVMEARHRIAIKDPNSPVRLSPAHLLSCGRSGGCKGGMYVADALVFAGNDGVGLEADFPYTARDEACRRIAPRLRLSRSTDACLTDREKKFVIEGEGPILALMDVYEDLTHYRSGVYRHVAGAHRGLHAVALVGYDDPGGFWIVQNSWGEGFGEQGFLRMAYGECGIGTYPVAVVGVEPA